MDSKKTNQDRASIPQGRPDKNGQPQGSTTTTTILPTVFERGTYSLEDFSKYNQGVSGGVNDIKDPGKDGKK